MFNAANEWAVNEFLNRRISYLDITDRIERAMEEHKVSDNPSVEDILEAEAWTYELLSGAGQL